MGLKQNILTLWSGSSSYFMHTSRVGRQVQMMVELSTRTDVFGHNHSVVSLYIPASFSGILNHCQVLYDRIQCKASQIVSRQTEVLLVKKSD